MRLVKVILIVGLAVVQAVVGIPSWMSDGSLPLRALSYSFFHANWWHLAVNSLALWCSFPSSTNPCKACRDLAVSYIIAVLCYPLAFRPVIGFSNVLYACIGLRTPSLRSPWWKRPAVKVFLAVSVAMLFVPRFSAVTHLAAFVAGMAVAACRRAVNNVFRDAGRYY